MRKYSKELPIMIGSNLRKGIFAFRSAKMKGYDLCIVWLKNEYKTGDKFEMGDIDKIQAVIHFCDKESVEQTIDVLKWILKNGIASAGEKENR